jgi:7,8-dihydroneopterin aldolase/epimerase/oxygenase
MAIISVEGMEFFAYHGCFAEEQIIGTKFLVDLFLEVNTETAEHSDHLSDTVNYQAVYQMVKDEMQLKSKLLENLGRRILDRIQVEFPDVENATIKVRKLNPPLGGKIDFVSVELKMR